MHGKRLSFCLFMCACQEELLASLKWCYFVGNATQLCWQHGLAARARSDHKKVTEWEWGGSAPLNLLSWNNNDMRYTPDTCIWINPSIGLDPLVIFPTYGKRISLEGFIMIFLVDRISDFFTFLLKSWLHTAKYIKAKATSLQKKPLIFNQTSHSDSFHSFSCARHLHSAQAHEKCNQ